MKTKPESPLNLSNLKKNPVLKLKIPLSHHKNQGQQHYATESTNYKKNPFTIVKGPFLKKIQN